MPHSISDDFAMSYANYGGKAFKLVIDNVRLITGIKEFLKPEGGKK